MVRTVNKLGSKIFMTIWKQPISIGRYWPNYVTIKFGNWEKRKKKNALINLDTTTHAYYDTDTRINHNHEKIQQTKKTNGITT